MGMAETKRKDRDNNRHGRVGISRKKKNNNIINSSKNEKEKRRKGPGLPNAMRKELGLLDRISAPSNSDDEDMESDSSARNDLYEFVESLPEEESKKNKRYDPVENFEYELPEDFENEEIESDEDENDGNDNDERHSRMLQRITGLPGEAFEGNKKEDHVLISEAYPESEYNPTRDVLQGESMISIQDLLGPLQGKSGFSKLRKHVHRMEKKSMSVHAPLPRPDQERVERKAAYEFSKKDMTKWEPLVKRNREAPTIYFDEDTDLGFSTVGAIASEFQPRTDFEKKIASLVNDNNLVEAHREDGARLLELNKISMEDVKNQQDRLAKMRSLLFRHEMKAKRIKKIKSKTYHRLLKKDRSKTTASMEIDPEAAKELTMKQEFNRAEERLTLKHKNTSRWAKRIKKRGLDVQDEGTRAALNEQLQQHALLTRKMNSMKESSDDSSDEDDSDDALADSDLDGPATLLKKAKEKTIEVMERDEELPMSGVLSLPFMVRGLKKRKEATDEEARLALEEYELSLKQLADNDEGESKKNSIVSGRMVFGTSQKQAPKSTHKLKSDNYYGNSDSDGDLEAEEDLKAGHDQRNSSQRDGDIDPDSFRAESEIGHDSILKSFEDIVNDPGPKTTYDVAIFASNSWKKMKDSPDIDGQKRTQNDRVSDSTKLAEPMNEEPIDENVDSDTDSDGHMVDGILSSGPKSTYELPSQEELIRRAFAGDDVEEDFGKDKDDVLNQENPEPEEPVLLPGWGQWTHVQQKKGLPHWMLEDHENAKKKREEALKKRKDAHLNHVIISEKLDKKAEKLHTKTLPFPYTSKEVFEQSIRMPIGPEFNPATAVGALNRPEVVKRPGVMIQPIKFKDINPHERTEDHKGRRHKQQKSKPKPNGKKK